MRRQKQFADTAPKLIEVNAPLDLFF